MPIFLQAASVLVSVISSHANLMIMKKLTLLIAIAALAAFGAQAQTAKGTLVLTGKAGYSQSKTKSDRDTNNPYNSHELYNYTLAPAFGYFIKDNLEIGATAHRYKFQYENINYFEGGSTTWNYGENNKGVSVYARQYSYLTEKLALHGTLSVGLSNQVYYTNTYSAGPYAQNSKSEFDAIRLNSSLSPGLTFFASNKIGLEASLGALKYSRSNTDFVNESSSYINSPDNPKRSESTHKRNALQFDFSSMHLNFGISYFLGK